MDATDIRALSDAVRRGLDLVLETTHRAELSALQDERVLRNLRGIHGSIMDLTHDWLRNGLDHIADCREDMEDSPATLAAQTRNDERRQLEGV